jgi:hypothetical protein
MPYFSQVKVVGPAEVVLLPALRDDPEVRGYLHRGLQLKPRDIPFDCYKEIAALLLRQFKYDAKNSSWADKYKDYTEGLARALELDESRSLSELKNMQNPDGTMRDPPHDELAKALLRFTKMMFTTAKTGQPPVADQYELINLETYSCLPDEVKESLNEMKEKSRQATIEAVVAIEIDLPPSVTTAEERGVFALDKCAEFCHFLDSRMKSGQRQHVLSVRICRENEEPFEKNGLDCLEMNFAKPVDFRWLQYALLEYPKFYEIRRWDAEAPHKKPIPTDEKTTEKFRRYGTYLNDEKVPICQAFPGGECDAYLEGYEAVKSKIQQNAASRYVRISALRFYRKHLLEYINQRKQEKKDKEEQEEKDIFSFHQILTEKLKDANADVKEVLNVMMLYVQPAPVYF